MKPIDRALGILVTILWGSNFSVIGVGLQSLDPFLLAALRFTFTALPLVLFVRRPANIGLPVLAAYGLLFGVGLWWVVNVAMAQGMSPGLSSLVLQFSAFFTIVLSAWVFRERLGRWQWAGMVVATTGLSAMIASTEASGTRVGIALVLFAAVCWSLCNLLVKRHRPADMLAFVAWSSVFSAPALLVLAWWSQGSAPFVALGDRLDGRAIFSVLFQAWVTTLFGYWVWNTLMKRYPAATVAPLSLLVPVSGLVTSWWVFDEHLSPATWCAVGVVLVGIALFLLAGRLRQPA
ncbi:membrane protein [Lysobacter helvus]|uniref:Membrane protein n=2 Tax=Lysobacteraceae TaxID=32033 RepID=A0ABN6G262_9GAMM|nr:MULTISPECIES: EamA family transporter [Lysobacter]BCT93992.1 membrane protein [Lysobacter caseinilyticus]BCT97148.1 membrane protein [Lysobacter helvus]